jgi:uncharacterized protein YwqG
MKKSMIDLSHLSEKEIRTRIRRKGSAIISGGFRPPDNIKLTNSFINDVKLSLPGEKWPTLNNQPMFPLFQLNLTEAPFVPKNLSDIEFMTVFAIDFGNENGNFGKNNGEGWLLRTYPSFKELVEIENKPQLEISGKRKGNVFPVRWEQIEDFPCDLDDDEIFFSLSDEMEEDFCDIFEGTYMGTKIGGWPYYCQSAFRWDNENIAYALQIETQLRPNYWPFASDSTIFFGRGTTDQNLWQAQWEFY